MYTYDRWNNSEKASFRVCPSLTNEKVERVEVGIRTPAGPTDSSSSASASPARSVQEPENCPCESARGDPAQPVSGIPPSALYSAILRCPGLT